MLIRHPEPRSIWWLLGRPYEMRISETREEDRIRVRFTLMPLPTIEEDFARSRGERPEERASRRLGKSR